MYYEFYLDLYFLENLILNILALKLSGRILGWKDAWVRMAAASVLGAFGACVLILIPLHKNKIVYLVSRLLLFLTVAGIGTGGRKTQLQRHVLASAGAAFLMLEALWQFLLQGCGLSFFVAAPLGYGIAWGIWKCYQTRKNRESYKYQVTLERKGKTVQLTALLDSGNHLTMPGTARPVHIVWQKAVQELFSREENQELEHFLEQKTNDSGSGTFLCVPYHSIEEHFGILPVGKVERIHIRQGETALNTGEELIALTQRAVSGSGEYQMILHPQILE